VDGKPLTSGLVRLTPDTPKPGPPVEATGAIGSDGSYKIMTNGKPGAPLGKYKVTVGVPAAAMGDEGDPSKPATEPGKAPPKLFNTRFENVGETPLQFEVVASPSPGQYDLKLTR